MIIDSKNRPTVRARLILPVVSIVENALTNGFIPEIFNQIDYWLNYNQCCLFIYISEFICEIYFTLVQALQCSF